MRFSFTTLTIEATSITNNPNSDDKTERHHQALQRILPRTHQLTLQTPRQTQCSRAAGQLDNGFNPDDDLLEKLLTLNLELAEKEKKGEAIVGPWAPNDSNQ